MKLTAIFNVWSDCLDTFDQSLKNISPLVDEVIVVWSEQSNYFVKDTQLREYLASADIPENCTLIQWEPEKGRQVHENETKKRNFGLNRAIERGANYFLMMDGDEFYIPEEFKAEYQRIQDKGLNGLVCRTKVLFGDPGLYVNDHTLVPFIQKVTPTIALGSFRQYPYAYDKNGPHIDPTRRTNQVRKVEMSEIYMYHASWIRHDYMKKVKNSAAKNNLLKSTIFNDLARAKEGYYCEFYRDTLKPIANHFNL
jgi:glycosyltransferase involved in cell wall biosynthesis